MPPVQHLLPGISQQAVPTCRLMGMVTRPLLQPLLATATCPAVNPIKAQGVVRAQGARYQQVHDRGGKAQEDSWCLAQAPAVLSQAVAMAAMR